MIPVTFVNSKELAVPKRALPKTTIDRIKIMMVKTKELERKSK